MIVVRHLSRLLPAADQALTDNDETNEQRGRTSSSESTARTNEETGADSATDRNHLHVSSFQITMQLVLIGLDNLNVVGLKTELATANVFTEGGSCDGLLLLLCLQHERLASGAHDGRAAMWSGYGKRPDEGGMSKQKSNNVRKKRTFFQLTKDEGHELDK